MNKTIAALEFSGKQIKLNIGYLINDKIHILYSYSEDISDCMNHVSITNKEKLLEKLKKLALIKDDDKKIKLSIKEIVLVLPSVGLEVYKIEKRSKIISPSGIIEKTDLESIVNQISSEPLSNVNQTLVDVIPYKFELDQNRAFFDPPIGQKTSIMNLRAHIYTLPTQIVNSYKNIVLAAGFKIKKITISSINIAELTLLNKIVDHNQAYLSLDIRKDMSIVSLVKKNLVYDSSCFLKGSNNFDNDLSESLGISIFSASKLRHMYGLNKDENNLDIKIKVEDEDETTNINLREYNHILEESLSNYSKDLKTCIDSMFENNPHKDKCVLYPIIVSGEGANMLGLVDILKKNLPDTSNIIKAKTLVIGADKLDNYNTLGAIYSALIYRGAYQDQKPKIASISREKEIDETPQEEGKEIL